MLGSPVAHSLSPVLHGAAYRELGLDWMFDRVEVDADGLPGFVAGLDRDWVGLAVTMPGKRAALAVAAQRSDRAVAVGAANTLTPLPDGTWRADCTDVSGVSGALRAVGGVSGTGGVVLGAGGTACAALAGLADLGVTEVAVVVREHARAAEAVATAERIGVRLDVRRWSDTDLGALAASAAVVVSTVPAGVADPAAVAKAPCVLDVIYHPWPTPLAEAVARRRGRLATGLDMLLHQAFDQVEQFTGKPAPREVMRDALRAATGGAVPLPLG